MTDETPQNPRAGLPPVRMALRVIGRHGHRGGPTLARAVADARAPKHLASATRLARSAAEAGAADALPAPAPAAAPAFGPPAAAPTTGLVPGVDRPNDPGLSDFAAEFLFGNASSATAGLTSMGQAAQMPEAASAKERRLARRKARGALDVSRAAKIIEGPADGPATADETVLPDVAAPAGPVPAPVKVSRTPADAPKPPSAPIPL